jgi:hypothetical protein
VGASDLNPTCFPPFGSATTIGLPLDYAKQRTDSLLIIAHDNNKPAFRVYAANDE